MDTGPWWRIMCTMASECAKIAANAVAQASGPAGIGRASQHEPRGGGIEQKEDYG